MPQSSITKITLKNTYLKSYSNFWANELTICGLMVPCGSTSCGHHCFQWAPTDFLWEIKYMYSHYHHHLHFHCDCICHNISSLSWSSSPLSHFPFWWLIHVINCKYVSSSHIFNLIKWVFYRTVFRNLSLMSKLYGRQRWKKLWTWLLKRQGQD